MKSGTSSKQPIGKRITRELREFAAVAAYLFICFAAILYLKAAVLRANGIEYAPFGFAAAKALICAKFISLGSAFHVGQRFRTLPVVWRTLWMSLAFLALLLVLNALEEIAMGAIHHRAVAATLAELGGGTLPQIVATSVVVLLILIPLFAFRTLGDAVGEGKLLRLLFRRYESLSDPQ
jgi:hypothetical protein